MKPQDTRFDRIISRIKNNPVTASVIVLGTIIIALAAFTDSVRTLLSVIEENRPEAARTELAQLSLEYTPDVFIETVKKGDAHAAALFLEAGMDPNAKDTNGVTALMYAARASDIPTIDLLLDAKANVNERTSGGSTALSWAVAGENEDVVGLLLERGADAEAIDEALVSAARSGRLEILRILLDKGVDVKLVGSEALMRAASSTTLGASEKQLNDVVRFLIELGADPNATNEEGWTALLNASIRGYASVVRTLLDAGANINAKCDCRGMLGGGWTALMLAIHKGHGEIVEALLNNGADVNNRNYRGQTALSLAIEKGDEDLVQALRDKGAKGAAGVVGAGLSSASVNAMLVRRDFFDKRRNASGKGIAHEYEPRAIGDAVVVIDHATRLMWQKGGSSLMTLDKAEDYIGRLNAERYAGFSDWRLPTLEEAMSLLEPEAYDEIHIDPVFQRGVNFIWTADRTPTGRGWMIYFYSGILAAETPQFNAWVRAVRLGSGANE